MSELLKINVNEHTEKKGGLTYLSWAWAWAEVLKADPRATWKAHIFDMGAGPEPFMRIGDTAMVQTTVTINGIPRDCLLPVMDNRNNAVKNPDARKISDAIMRCMTKAIAMHGLGLYIYAGEDLPEGEESDSLVPALEASIAHVEKARTGALAAAAEEAGRGLTAEQRVALKKLAEQVKVHLPVTAYELIEEQGLNSDEKTFLWGELPSNVRSALKREGQVRSLTHNQPKETA
jgi:hypothetical protein